MDSSTSAWDETQAAIVSLVTDAPDWKSLAAGGLLALTLPTGLGGDGLGPQATFALLTELGRHTGGAPASTPLTAVESPVAAAAARMQTGWIGAQALSTLALGVLPIVRWGTAEQQRELLPEVASGQRQFSAAVRDAWFTGTAELRITGEAPDVWGAASAHRLLVPVDIDGRRLLVLVDPGADGVSLVPSHSSGGSDGYQVKMDNAQADAVLGDERAWPDLERIALAAAAALGDGLLAGALELTRMHVGLREQFGRPLSTFQAVAGQIADVYIASRTLHLAAAAAAFSDDPADVLVAAYWLAVEGPPAMRTCHHLHGGLGMDVDYPLHRYSAALKDLVRFVGGAESRIEALGGADVHRAG